MELSIWNLSSKQTFTNWLNLKIVLKGQDNVFHHVRKLNPLIWDGHSPYNCRTSLIIIAIIQKLYFRPYGEYKNLKSMNSLIWGTNFKEQLLMVRLLYLDFVASEILGAVLKASTHLHI